MEPGIRYDLIYVVGPPGSGKSSVCSALAEGRGDHVLQTARSNPSLLAETGEQPLLVKYNHLSVGNHLRRLRSERDYDGRYHSFRLDASLRVSIGEHLDADKLLPSEVIVPLLVGELSRGTREPPLASGPSPASLIDGFPRTLDTGRDLDSQMGRPWRMVELELPRETAKQRYVCRGREAADDEARFDKRYEEYTERMKDIREHYGETIVTVQADGTPEECIERFVNALWWEGLDAIQGRREHNIYPM
ncbi:P-loop containing nucleoside triphosphate hydrolase protein [Xylariaceae sp. FL0804]|nr:P-loop containing nucleoside triphosphate hydrolase protein [Xylariaceae sp. FL0804]